MDYIRFEHLLDKNLSITKEAIGSDFENTLFSESFYYISDKSIKKDFYGMEYNSLSIETNEKDTVQSISVHFPKVINRQFYDAFIKKYGEPTSIFVIEKRKVVSETKSNEGHFKKSDIDLREGTFEENPLFIIWKKENFQIKAFLRHRQNMSEITFSIPLD
ncbi:hypothetical protein [uncultured Lacinutrix sp.]|uniref:hypothetical protein n=1 Tax=uncultured Lacinutrix sp. TaxID=574032 RepID=UPI00260C2957|nr:hypothetical protein [uncultured Lacinutrix sp.]